jgi:hypothetical protein
MVFFKRAVTGTIKKNIEDRDYIFLCIAACYRFENILIYDVKQSVYYSQYMYNLNWKGAYNLPLVH